MKNEYYDLIEKGLTKLFNNKSLLKHRYEVESFNRKSDSNVNLTITSYMRGRYDVCRFGKRRVKFLEDLLNIKIPYCDDKEIYITQEDAYKLLTYLKLQGYC